MWEDFLTWIKLKFKIQQKVARPTFKEKEIWWCYLGQNIGDEENGKNISFNRPVIILKKFNKNLAIVVPTSTKLKDNIYYIDIFYSSRQYSALISQIRALDSKRLQNKIGELNQKDFIKIKQEIGKFWE
jgi:mRNA interferase MazF